MEPERTNEGDPHRVLIFDTTLRDGEQSAGVAFTATEKLAIARQLERLGVDVIEAGFPCASPGDLQAVRTIAAAVRETTICALARAVRADIDAAWEAVKAAADPRIHVFINTSAIQIENQLRKTPAAVLEQAAEMVRYAARHTSNVEFSPMDATRTAPEFLHRIIARCIAAGATTINVPDSVGYSLPDEIEALFAGLVEVPGIERVRLSVHAHNDLGLSTANALAAIRGGARQVEVTVNGIGERAGNSSLEEVVMALETRRDRLGLTTGIDTTEIYRTSKLVESRSGMRVQWNKAIVGLNSFRHSSGIHQDGILKHRATWEIMNPAAIGIPDGTQLVLGKLSGRHAFAHAVAELGFELTEAELERAFSAFKELADKRTQVDHRDVEAIVIEQLGDVEQPSWRLDRVQVSAGNDATATATLCLRDAAGRSHQDAATGTGPVDAVYRAMNRITGVAPRLAEFRVGSVTAGIDAQGEVTIRIEEDGRCYAGHAADTDIVVASARAYTTALNRLVAARERRATSAGEEVGRCNAAR